MSRTGTAIRRFWAHRGGSASVEFAIVAPILIVMLAAVIQIGLALQNYNALRNISADVARHAMIQYATGNKLTNSQLGSYTRGVASAAPYLLTSTTNVVVADAATPQIAGVKEKTLTIQYTVPSLFSAMGLGGFTITYTRPVFLVT
jgi:Flp pilus assembly protein TadG